MNNEDWKQTCPIGPMNDKGLKSSIIHWLWLKANISWFISIKNKYGKIGQSSKQKGTFVDTFALVQIHRSSNGFK